MASLPPPATSRSVGVRLDGIRTALILTASVLAPLKTLAAPIELTAAALISVAVVGAFRREGADGANLNGRVGGDGGGGEGQDSEGGETEEVHFGDVGGC